MGQMHGCLTTVIEKVQEAEEVKATKTKYHRLGDTTNSLFSYSSEGIEFLVIHSASMFGCSWGLSPWLANGCLFTMSPQGLLSVHIHPCCLSLLLWRHLLYWINHTLMSFFKTLITSLKALSPNTVVFYIGWNNSGRIMGTRLVFKSSDHWSKKEYSRRSGKICNSFFKLCGHLLPSGNWLVNCFSWLEPGVMKQYIQC